MDTTLILPTGKSIQTVLDSVALEGELSALVDEASGPEALLETLVQAEHFTEAIALLAHALPPREAVGWAWVCASEVAGADAPAKTQESLAATRSWIREPSDNARRHAFEMAEAAGFGEPAGMVGLGVFACGDTMGPADTAPAPPPPDLVGIAVAGCISLCVTSGDPATIPDRYVDFIQRGQALAVRVKLWDALPSGPGTATPETEATPL